jgi:hypothetical protein
MPNIVLWVSLFCLTVGGATWKYMTDTYGWEDNREQGFKLWFISFITLLSAVSTLVSAMAIFLSVVVLVAS